MRHELVEYHPVFSKLSWWSKRRATGSYYECTCGTKIWGDHVGASMGWRDHMREHHEIWHRQGEFL